MHKYRATPTVIDGVRFASKREARRYQELKLLVKAGEITNLLLQPVYVLYVRPFMSPDGEIVKVGKYIGDFQYFDRQGRKVLEDVKGVRTDTYKLKKRIVEALYGITIQEV